MGDYPMASESKVLALYERHCSRIKKVGQSQYQALCPFHEENNPSFGFNTEFTTYKCFSCGVKGNAVQFAKHFNEDPKPFYSDNPPLNGGKQAGITQETNGKQTDTVDKTTDNNSKIIIPNEEKSILKEIWTKDYCSFMYEYMYEWQDSEYKNLNMVGMYEGHMVFPYFGEDGETVVGIHHHKSAPHWTGDGKNKWYNVWNVQFMDKKKPLIICEGEKDCNKLLDNGYNAVTVSGGVGTCPKRGEHNFIPKEFKDFPEIIIHFDNDDAGRKGAKRLADIIYECLGVLPYITKWRKGLPDKFDPSDKDGIRETAIAIENKVIHKTKRLRKIGAFTIMTDMEMSNKIVKPREWIVENILPARANGILAGTTGAKKSWWVMQLGMSIANGEKEVFGNKIIKPLKVLYVDTEIGEEGVVARFQQLQNKIDWKNNGSWMAVTKDGTTLDVWDDIHTLINEVFKPDLLIIDSLYNSTKANDLSKATPMGNITNALTQFKIDYGISVLTVGHFIKNRGELGLDINRMSGSNVLQNWIEWCMIMTTTNVTNLNLWTVGKTRYTYHDYSVYGLEFDDDCWITPKGIITNPRDYLIDEDKRSKWHNVLEDCPDEFTTLEWLNVFNAKCSGMSERTGKLWLSECSKTQMLEKISHGLYKKKLGVIDEV